MFYLLLVLFEQQLHLANVNARVSLSPFMLFVSLVCRQTARGDFSLRTERCELSLAFKQATATAVAVVVSGSDASATAKTI